MTRGNVRPIISVGARPAFPPVAPNAHLPPDDLRLRALDLDLRGHVGLAKWLTAPTVAGEIELAPFTPRKLLDRLGQAQPVCADPKVLGRASLKAKVNGTATSLRLSELLVVLDDSKLTGTLAVDGFDRPAVRCDLALDAIDVDRYLPPPADRMDE